VEDTRLSPDQLVIVTGKDFEAVVKNGAPVPTSSASSASATTTSIPREEEYTEPVGIVPEAPPEGTC
jgi:hypothetical protein